MEHPVMDENEQDEREELKQEWERLNEEQEQLAEERRCIESEKRKLETERRALLRSKESEAARSRQERQLFDMKWKILQEELVKLAKDKQLLQRQKEFYRRVHDFQGNVSHTPTTAVLRGERFFIGVSDRMSLKKRYKDLLKIYHPDNLAGDTRTIQEINREYDKLKKQFE